MPSITPHLWFDKEAVDAAKLYCSIFPNSRIIENETIDDTGPNLDESVNIVKFEIEGQQVIAMNAGPHFKLDEAFSFFVECETQEEVDHYWDKLTADGGQESQCGWLKDKYGVSWQIIPKLLGELMSDKDPARSRSVMEAMMKMKKIDSDALRRAYDQPVSV